jgi:Flp pilus assembly protein TadG
VTTTRAPIHQVRQLVDEHPERGSIALSMALAAFGLLMMAGLVIDGGAAIATRARAVNVSEQAARAGADALSQTSLRSGSPSSLTADAGAARMAAVRMLAAANATGDVRVAGATVTVTARVPCRAVVLSAVGVGDLSQSQTSTAVALYGTDRAGGQ